MMTAETQQVSTPSRYIYGTTRLGDSGIAFEHRVAMARMAIEAGLWIHTSDQYGDALTVIKEAIQSTPTQVEGTIFKIGYSTVDEVRGQIERQLKATGLSQMSIGQLCLGGELAEDFKAEGRLIDDLLALQTEGLVQEYVLELWPWSSDVGLAGLLNGNAHRLLKAFIFYCNPLQRFISNELWDAMMSHNQAFIAMRTVSGGSVYRVRDKQGAAPDYLQSRAVDIAPIYERSGCDTWTEFGVRFALGFPNCLATVGATSSPERLQQFLDAAKDSQPLAPAIQEEILIHQRKWAEEHDQFKEPWSM
jgi:hypothetical protein